MSTQPAPATKELSSALTVEIDERIAAISADIEAYRCLYRKINESNLHKMMGDMNIHLAEKGFTPELSQTAENTEALGAHRDHILLKSEGVLQSITGVSEAIELYIGVRQEEIEALRVEGEMERQRLEEEKNAERRSREITFEEHECREEVERLRKKAEEIRSTLRAKPGLIRGARLYFNTQGGKTLHPHDNPEDRKTLVAIYDKTREDLAGAQQRLEAMTGATECDPVL